jgi:hypothetical protein
VVIPRGELREGAMNPVVLAIMAAILTAWIGIGVVVITYGTPLGVAFYVLAVVATNPRVWRLH